MRTWGCTFIVFILTTASSLGAQEGVEVFGYFQSQAMGVEFSKEVVQLYSNTLRIDLASQVSERVSFGANVDYITYHGHTRWNTLDALPDRIASSVPEDRAPFYVIAFSDRTFLDNAYIRLAFRYGDLTVGKQQISFGTGYVWNPVDVFNIKDVLDPTYEQPGHNAVRADIPLGDRYTFAALYAPEDTWRRSARLIRLKGRISRFDYALVAIQRRWVVHDYTQLNAEGMGFMELPERRRVLGGSTAGETFGIGVWAEYGYNDMEHSEDFCELVVGADYTFDVQTYLMVEFYRNTLGRTDSDEYTLNDWMRLLVAEQKAIARDQAYVLLQHPATDLLSVSLSGIYTISDKSLALVPTLEYSLSENTEITAYLNVNFGDEGTMFARELGDSGLVRVRAYF